jgi:23S rRNA (cytidine1920-2'-O)/16S rRNA (cytidine1409-2'-O)-methyltransferase
VFYTLIKPQFEAGPDRVGKKGVVREAKVHEDVLSEIVEFCPTMGWQVQALDYSPIKGPEGNIEFLAKITVRTQEQEPCSREYIHELVSRAHADMKG